MIKKRLSPTDYLLMTALIGVLVIFSANNLQEQAARVLGIIFGLLVVCVALGIGAYQHKQRSNG